jgi:flavin reductase ActVB
MVAVEPAAFRNAMSEFASGVTVVTTNSPEGAPVAFTASAFSSLSLDPPLVLVCLEKKADSHPAFEQAEQMAISILAAGQDDVAMRFATRGTDKFAGFESEPGEVTGLPLVPGALVHLECRIADRLPGGDHTILVGEVLTANTHRREPMIHHNRRFGRFQPTA